MILLIKKVYLHACQSLSSREDSTIIYPRTKEWARNYKMYCESGGSGSRMEWLKVAKNELKTKNKQRLFAQMDFTNGEPTDPVKAGGTFRLPRLMVPSDCQGS